MSSSDFAQPIESSWSFFEMQFRRHRLLEQDPLYALPVRLIDALQELIPELLSEQEWEFERALADWSGHGFFGRAPFVHPLLESHAVPRLARTEHDVHVQQSVRLDEMLDDEMKRIGQSDARIELLREQTEAIRRRSRACARGYLGWLVTDRGYREEFQQLSSAWPERIWRAGFPVIPMSIRRPFTAPVPEQDWEFVAAARFFLQRWSLETLVTPDLPLPLLPQLSAPAAYDPEWVGESGVSVYVPNYLFRERSISLLEIAELEQSFGHLTHLDGWLQERRKNWGALRFGHILDMFVYLELALKARYSERLTGVAESIDLAFASFWQRVSVRALKGSSSDSARGIRGELRRRLQVGETGDSSQGGADS